MGQDSREASRRNERNTHETTISIIILKHPRCSAIKSGTFLLMIVSTPIYDAFFVFNFFVKAWGVEGLYKYNIIMILE